MTTYNAKHFHYSEKLLCYTADISDMGIKTVPAKEFLMVSMANHPPIPFRFTRWDKNGEDIMGWNYEEVGGPRRCLIIND